MVEDEKAPRLKGWALPWIYPTGLFIRDYLKKHGVGYSQEIWRELKKVREKAGLNASSYESFRKNYMWTLKRLGLIEEVKREPAARKEWFQRIYYRIVPGKEADPRWSKPQIALDPRRGAPRYRREYEKRRKKRMAPKPLSPEELDRVWESAAAFLKEYGYILTREEFETVVPQWPSEAGLYPTFEQRVGYAVRRAVEVEYVSRIARRLISLEEAPKPLMREALKVARTMEREWLRKHT
jgi:hypothetical protein